MSQSPELFPSPPAEEETRRLQALRELGVLDTAPEVVFDELAALAAQVCGAPMAAVSLIDTDRQWFKARHGFDAEQTPRSQALCAYAILGDELLYLPDTRLDPRFAGHPAVVGGMGVRFYAGAPLVGTHGERYGSLCVFDTQPRTLSPEQRAALSALARQATAQFEARRARRWAAARDIAMQSLVDALPDGVIALGPDRRIHLLNRAARDLFGDAYEGTGLADWTRLGRVIDLRTGRELAVEDYPLARAMRGETVCNQLIAVESFDGRRVTLMCSAEPVTPAGGAPSAAILVGRPADGDAGAPDPLLERLLDALDEGVLTTDRAGRVTYLNRRAATLTGREDRDPHGRHVDELVRLLDPADVAPSQRFGIAAASGGPAETGEARLLGTDGAVAEVQHRSLALRDASGEVQRHVVLLRDVTALNTLRRELAQGSVLDAQTGIPTRTAAEGMILAALEDARKGAVSHLLYIDLDRFKVVNDTCGHLAGDHVLAQAATAIQSALGPRHTVCRFHGDEFLVVLGGVDRDGAAALGEQLRRDVEGTRFHWGDVPFTLSASIGIVPVTADATVAELVGRALSMCELAKEQGRNRSLLHHPDDARLIEHRVRLDHRTRIQRALEENRLVLHGQRIQPLAADTQWHHVEVLVRLQDEDGSLLPPGAFIPAAERYGLMTQVDRQVVSSALAALACCASARRPLLAINLSGHSLADDAFPGFVAAQFRAHRVEYAQVCFEITETAAISNIRQAEAFIRRFRERGSRFSLDDFGSGMSSFAYLKRLPIDYLKIDGAFVRHMADSHFDQAMVRAVQSVARATGLRTIAEYVETPEVAAALRAIGVDYAQGYGIHRPEPLADVLGCAPPARLW